MANDAGDEQPHSGLNKVYYACFTRPVKPLAELEAHLEEHKAYLGVIEKRGGMFAAGPLLNADGRYDGNGLIVYRTKTREEARALADGDPFHALGLRTYDLFPWQVNEGSFELRLLYSAGTFELG